MAVSHEYASPTLYVERHILTFGELVAREETELLMPVPAANLTPGQLVALTNVEAVVPLMNTEARGHRYMGQHPADILVNGEYRSLTDDPEAERKAASHTPANRLALAIAEAGLPPRLFRGKLSVADVHRQSIDKLDPPGRKSRVQPVSKLMQQLGSHAAVLMESLAGNGLIGEAVHDDGTIISASEIVKPGDLADNRKYSTIFGFGKNPRSGNTPHPVGAVAMGMFRNFLRGEKSTTVLADGSLLRELGNERQLTALDLTLAEARRAASIRAGRSLGAVAARAAELTVIDITDALQVSDLYSTSSQYDLIRRYPGERQHRKANVAESRYDWFISNARVE